MLHWIPTKWHETNPKHRTSRRWLSNVGEFEEKSGRFRFKGGRFECGIGGVEILVLSSFCWNCREGDGEVCERDSVSDRLNIN